MSFCGHFLIVMLLFMFFVLLLCFCFVVLFLFFVVFWGNLITGVHNSVIFKLVSYLFTPVSMEVSVTCPDHTGADRTRNTSDLFVFRHNPRQTSLLLDEIIPIRLFWDRANEKKLYLFKIYKWTNNVSYVNV